MGKKKYISSPSELWDLFVAYELWVQSKPYESDDWVGKDAKKVTRKQARFVSWLGFESYLAREDKIQRLDDYRTNKDDRYGKYADVITRIRTIIDGEVMTAALSGVANGNIASSLLGLTKKHEVETGSKDVPLFPDITYDDFEDVTDQNLLE